MHEIGVRRPLNSSTNDASTIDADDLYIGSGSVTAVQSCTDATGNTLLSSETTRITKLPFGEFQIKRHHNFRRH